MPPPGGEAVLPPDPQSSPSADATVPATPAQPASGAGALPVAAAVTPGADGGRAAATSATPGAATPASAASAPNPVAGTTVAADGVVVFRTRGPSWVQVTDAGGTTVLRRLMGAGDSAGATGKLPLAVTVGDASQTDVQVRGKAFDLAPLTRDNVARFEVK
jgi:cytoskeleton protein RodZ